MKTSKKQKEAIEMLDKFIIEHKLYNIKQSDGLEDNIKIVLYLIEKLQKENEELKAKWDKDTHILQNKLDYANADRIDLAQQNKELKQDYYNLINKIENKIDRFDYEFEKAKRQDNENKSDYYWNLIINFKKLLGGE